MVGRIALALALLVAACGRLGFTPGDTADGGLDAVGTALEVTNACETVGFVGLPYYCYADVAGDLAVEWTRGSATTCGWASVHASTGKASGTPDVAGTCTIEVVATSADGGQGSTSWTVSSQVGVKQVDVGAWHTCALSTDGRVRCWGDSVFGQLGYNDTGDVAHGPAERTIAAMGDVPVGGKVVHISLAYDQTCAVLDTGGVRCWGLGANSRLGYTHTQNVGAGGAGGTIISNGDIALGGKAVHVAAIGCCGGCAIMESGNVRCWGSYHGHGHMTPLTGSAIAAAGDVPIGAGPIVQLAAGYGHVCALTAAGSVRCWGGGSIGELGYGDGSDVGIGGTSPSIVAAGDVPVGGVVKQIAAGNFTTCAVLDTGAARCWGYNNHGQLGYDHTTFIADGVGPTIIAAGDVPFGKPVRHIWTGEEHTCGVGTDGSVRCWGLNLEGQLGYNDTAKVGDGTPGRSIMAMGDVVLGAGASVLEVVTTDWDTSFTCALMASRGVRCWGFNASGQLGRDHTLQIGKGTAGGAVADYDDLHPFGN